MGPYTIIPTVLPVCSKCSARKVSLMHFFYSEDVAVEYLHHTYKCKDFLCSLRHISCFWLRWQFSLSKIHPVFLTVLLDHKQLFAVPLHPLPLNTLPKFPALSKPVNRNNGLRGDRDIPGWKTGLSPSLSHCAADRTLLSTPTLWHITQTLVNYPAWLLRK